MANIFIQIVDDVKCVKKYVKQNKLYIANCFIRNKKYTYLNLCKFEIF